MRWSVRIAGRRVRGSCCLAARRKCTFPAHASLWMTEAAFPRVRAVSRGCPPLPARSLSRDVSSGRATSSGPACSRMDSSGVPPGGGCIAGSMPTPTFLTRSICGCEARGSSSLQRPCSAVGRRRSSTEPPASWRRRWPSRWPCRRGAVRSGRRPEGPAGAVAVVRRRHGRGPTVHHRRAHGVGHRSLGAADGCRPGARRAPVTRRRRPERAGRGGRRARFRARHASCSAGGRACRSPCRVTDGITAAGLAGAGRADRRPTASRAGCGRQGRGPRGPGFSEPPGGDRV